MVIIGYFNVEKEEPKGKIVFKHDMPMPKSIGLIKQDHNSSGETLLLKEKMYAKCK